MAAANIGYFLERSTGRPVLNSEDPKKVLDAISSSAYNALKNEILSGGIEQSDWKVKTPNQLVLLESVAGLNTANIQEVPKCHARGKKPNHAHDVSIFKNLLPKSLSMNEEGSFKGLTVAEDLQSATVYVAGSKFFIEQYGFEALRTGLEQFADCIGNMPKFSSAYKFAKEILDGMPLMSSTSGALYKKLPPILMQ